MDDKLTCVANCHYLIQYIPIQNFIYAALLQNVGIHGADHEQLSPSIESIKVELYFLYFENCLDFTSRKSR